MKRVLLAALLAGSAVYGVPSASAAPSTCAGTGQAILGSGIAYFPTVSTNVSFTFTFNCAEGGSFTGNGVLATASCGRSTGAGTLASTGQAFTVETVGSMLVATATDGSFVAAGNATPIPDTSTIPFGNSCSNGSARVFQLTGGAVFNT